MRIVVALLFVVVCGRPLAAQAVVGKLVEEGTRAPVARPRVWLVDGAGRAVATAQTRADGGFTLAAPAPGTYRVRAEGAGRAAIVSDALALAAGAPSALEMVAARAPAGGVVTGFVRDIATGWVVAGVRVYLAGELVARGGVAYETLSGEDGAFRLEGVPAGRYLVSWEHPMGQETVPVEVEVTAGSESPVRLAVEGLPTAPSGDVTAAEGARDSAIALAPLEVTAEVSRRRLTAYGFYERSRVSGGVFMTTADFVKRRGARLIDRIQGLRGVYARPVHGGSWIFYQFQQGDRRGAGCIVPLWINGQRAAVRELERIPPEDVEGIEVYSGDEVPLRFAHVGILGGRVACGAVVVWTKAQL